MWYTIININEKRIYMVQNDFKIIGSNTVEVYYKGYIALFDLEDFNYLNKSRIYFSEHYLPKGKVYVNIQTFLDGRKQSVSRVILREKRKDKVVDHINGNRLDNRKINLRSISFKDNAKNKFNYSNNRTSKMSGVTYISKKEIWVARIQVNGKRIFLGSSKDKNKAISLRKAAEKLYYSGIKKH